MSLLPTNRHKQPPSHCPMHRRWPRLPLARLGCQRHLYSRPSGGLTSSSVLFPTIARIALTCCCTGNGRVPSHQTASWISRRFGRALQNSAPGKSHGRRRCRRNGPCVWAVRCVVRFPPQPPGRPDTQVLPRHNVATGSDHSFCSLCFTSNTSRFSLITTAVALM